MVLVSLIHGLKWAKEDTVELKFIEIMILKSLRWFGTDFVYMDAMCFKDPSSRS